MSAPRRMIVEVIDDATAAMFRATTPAQRVAFAAARRCGVRATLARYVRHEHPHWSDADVTREAARMMLVASGNDPVPPLSFREDCFADEEPAPA